MREWLSGGTPPCQGGGRGFDPRLALTLTLIRLMIQTDFSYMSNNSIRYILLH